MTAVDEATFGELAEEMARRESFSLDRLVEGQAPAFVELIRRLLRAMKADLITGPQVTEAFDRAGEPGLAHLLEEVGA